MTFTPIDATKGKNLLRHEQYSEQKRASEKWVDYPALFKAVKAGAHTVTMCGRDFVINYREGERIYLQPSDITAYAPCGHFNLSELKSKAALA